MTMNVPALKVDFEKINYNLENGLIAPGEKVDGNTGTNYQGLGVANNASASDDIAAFFSAYAQETPETWFQQIDIFTKKGQAFMQDLATFTGEDGYLTQEELQAWADKNKFRGDINKVMQSLADVDNELFGKGTMDIEMVDPSMFEKPEAVEPEPTEPEPTEPEPTTDPNAQNGASSQSTTIVNGADNNVTIINGETIIIDETYINEESNTQVNNVNVHKTPWQKFWDNLLGVFA